MLSKPSQKQSRSISSSLDDSGRGKSVEHDRQLGSVVIAVEEVTAENVMEGWLAAVMATMVCMDTGQSACLIRELIH